MLSVSLDAPSNKIAGFSLESTNSSPLNSTPVELFEFVSPSRFSAPFVASVVVGGGGVVVVFEFC